MKQALIFASFGCALTSYAAPTITVAPSRIGERCTNLRLEGQNSNWLVGDCSTGKGQSVITSGTYLGNKIGNSDGVLVWTNNGRFDRSCSDCKVVNAGLNCQCTRSAVGTQDTTLILDQHIGVFSGHLLSDLKGTPKVPSAPSKFSWPSDLVYGVGGNATCPSSPHGSATSDWCTSVAHKCSDSTPQDTSQINISFDGPTSDCTQAYVWFNDPQSMLSYSALKLIGKGAWQLVGYADKDCKKEIAGISPEDMGKCKAQQTQVVAFKVRPAFNGDPN